MAAQGFPRGSCLVENLDGSKELACNNTLRYMPETGYERLIKSVLLSRPEDYLSIYQSGCNHSCLKCHSHEFSKVATGEWVSPEEIAVIAKRYRKIVTVFESRKAATSWHAHRLCHHCGTCVVTGKPSTNCPRELKPEQIVLSPQGFGPARNIVAFTGGDILCKPEYYTTAATMIKAASNDLWVLLETNGYGLTPANLEIYANGGIDAFWLDIKAYSEDVYRKLCGTTNKHILRSIERIIDHGFTLEVLTLYIPELVETDEHLKIAQLITEIDPKIPTTLLAFFPCYKLLEPPNRVPTAQEMVKRYLAMHGEGLENLRIGNLGVFLKDEKDIKYIDKVLGLGYT